MVFAMVQETYVGEDAGVPISTYRFSLPKKVLFVVVVVVPTVVLAFIQFMRFVASLKDT